MPNHCENRLSIRGPQALRLELAKTIRNESEKNGHIDFDKIIPYPEMYKKLDDEMRTFRKKTDSFLAFRCPTHGLVAKARQGNATGKLLCLECDSEVTQAKDGFNSGGYEWRCSNWGTKWNASYQGEPNHGRVVSNYWFDTAWGPPEPIVRKLSFDWPMLEFRLDYAGEVDNPGGFICQKGRVTEEWAGKYRPKQKKKPRRQRG
jgi:hypothetical protein